MRSGAVISSFGAMLLVILAAILLVYPIVKNCHEQKCIFATSAPSPLNSFAKPSWLAISLVIIATGVAVIRFGSWYQYKSRKAENGLGENG
ncbi:MAG: hypothetical protein WB988_01810 [Candidatus Nitrosopolaris sp.]|jgi:hypothetical protein